MAEVRDTVRLPLDDISVAEDSGWRVLDEDRVSELLDVFKHGDFGATTLAMPSILCDDDSKPILSREDGRARLNNGKSTVAALKKLREEWLPSGGAGGSDPASVAVGGLENPILAASRKCAS